MAFAMKMKWMDFLKGVLYIPVHYTYIFEGGDGWEINLIV